MRLFVPYVDVDVSYRILKGGWFKGGGYTGALRTLGKLREYKGIMGITRLPTPPLTPPLKDILSKLLDPKSESLNHSSLNP